MEFFNMLNALNSANSTNSSDTVSRMNIDYEVIEKLVSTYEIRAMNIRRNTVNPINQLETENSRSLEQLGCLERRGEPPAPSVPGPKGGRRSEEQLGCLERRRSEEQRGEPPTTSVLGLKRGGTSEEQLGCLERRRSEEQLACLDRGGNESKMISNKFKL